MNLISSAWDKTKTGVSWIGNLPDKPSKPWQRKILYIVFDLGLILLAFAAVSFIIGGLHNPLQLFSATNMHGIAQGFLNPGASIAVAPLAFGGMGLGLSFLITDIVGKKHRKTASKVLSAAIPLLLVGGCVLLMMSGGMSRGASGGLHYDFSHSITSTAFYVGLLALPFVFLTINRAADLWSAKEIHAVTSGENKGRVKIHRQPNGKKHQEEAIRLDKEQQSKRKVQEWIELNERGASSSESD